MHVAIEDRQALLGANRRRQQRHDGHDEWEESHIVSSIALYDAIA
jgi:hypothetical protein